MRLQPTFTRRAVPLVPSLRYGLLRSPLLWLALVPSLAGCGEAGDVEPWEGTLRDGVLAMAEEAEGGQIDAALSIADQMLSPGGTARLRERLNGATRGVSESVLSPITSALDFIGVSALRSTDRAEIEYARAATLLAGAAQGTEEAPGYLERAETALERARGAAPGDVRKSAVYNQGTLDLMAAEAVRATIPEIAGAGGAGPTSPPDPNQAGAEDAPDPLDVARSLYLQSRDHLIEYLTGYQAGDEGGDAGANVELVIRRLRELDEIEKQREEQQQDQDQSEDGEEGEQDKQDPSEDEQENEDQQSSDDEQKSEEDPSEDQGEQDPSKESPEEEPEEEPGDEPEEEPEEEPAEGEEETDQDEQPKPGEETIEETTMTAEEFQRLLEQNKEHQERGEEIRRLRRMRGKIPAKKDW
jgi:hypothetical protein